jgi:hypothetical protein
MPHPSALAASDLLPFVPVAAGLWLCTERFRAHDALLGLVFGLAGMLLMVVVAVWQSRAR